MTKLARKSFPVNIRGVESTLHVNFDDTVADPIHSVLQSGRMWGTDLIAVAQKFWKSSDLTIVDIGAHIGTFSLLASQHTYGKVIAVEASPKNFAVLDRNIRDNKIKNIEALNFAAARKLGQVRFSGGGSGAHVSDGKDDIRVTAMPLDDILLSEKKIDFIKLDIEGYEIEAINGMKKVLARDKPVILYEVNGHTLNFFEETPNSLFRTLFALGYESYLIDRPFMLMHTETPFPFGVRDCIAVPRGQTIPSARTTDFSPQELATLFDQSNRNGNADIKNWLEVYDQKLEKGTA